MRIFYKCIAAASGVGILDEELKKSSLGAGGAWVYIG
jgi:hypothetical protein